MHQIAECCQYDLSEAERQPILQAEALKERDREIARLRNQVVILGGQPIKVESPIDEQAGRASIAPPKVPPKPANISQRRFHDGSAEASLYFGTPGIANVIEEVSQHQVCCSSALLLFGILLTALSLRTSRSNRKRQILPTMFLAVQTSLPFRWLHPTPSPPCGTPVLKWNPSWKPCLPMPSSSCI